MGGLDSVISRSDCDPSEGREDGVGISDNTSSELVSIDRTLRRRRAMHRVEIEDTKRERSKLYCADASQSIFARES